MQPKHLVVAGKNREKDQSLSAQKKPLPQWKRPFQDVIDW